MESAQTGNPERKTFYHLTAFDYWII
jgi:hypothetical protein